MLPIRVVSNQKLTIKFIFVAALLSMYIAFKSKNNNIGLNICLFFSIHINEFVLSP